MTDVIVVADDLTGAAEIAALRHRQGRPALVRRDSGREALDAPFQVFDTDSRLDPSTVAIGKINRLVASLDPSAPVLWYKKVDSVLRGSVKAECTALAEGLQRPRILLVPANPSLGRTLQQGHLFVAGVPLGETPFARDPHHPATSSAVVALLERSPGFPARSATVGSALADRVVTVGDATSPADLERWATALDASVLAAGGAEFFEAVLRHHSPTPATTAIPALPPKLPPSLVVLGSIDPASQSWRETIGGHPRACLHPLPAVLLEGAPGSDHERAWLASAAGALADGRHVISWVPTPPRPFPDLPLRARQALAAVATALTRRASLGHLVVAGGSTAATLLEALHWQRLSIVHEWGPGVVTLRPAEAPEFSITIKPGSYDWTAALHAALFPA